MYGIHRYVNYINVRFDSYMSHSQARQTRPNSGGVAEGYPRFDKGGGGCNNFLLFTR